MEDFYKRFKRNLEERPEPEFDPQLWRKMEQELDREQQPPRALLPYLAAAAILLLTLLNGWWWWQWRQTTSVVATPQIVRDTIVQQRTVYLRDTIVETRTVYRSVVTPAKSNDSRLLNFESLVNVSDFPTFGKIPAAERTDRWGYHDLSPQSSSVAAAVARRLGKNTVTVTTKKEPASTAKENMALASLPMDYQLLTTSVADLSLPTLSTTPLTERWLERELYAIRPKGATLGLTGSYIVPLRSGIDAESSVAFGAELNLTYHSPLQLWLSAQRQQFNFSTNVMDDALGVPAVTPPLDDFVFEQADVEQSLQQYAAGLRYHFLHKKHWQPFVGVGYVALGIQPYQVTYHFEGTLDDAEIELDREYRQDDLLLNFILLQTGVHFQPADRWSLRLGVHYRRAWEREALRTFDGISAQVGVHYGF